MEKSHTPRAHLGITFRSKLANTVQALMLKTNSLEMQILLVIQTLCLDGAGKG